MKDTQRNTCIHIVETIIQHPASGPFRKPIDIEALPNYYEIIEDPQDFGGILERLKNKDIRSLREFKRDMNLIWENAVKYNGKSSWPAALAHQCKKIFESEMKRKMPQSTIQWFEQVNLYQKKLQHLTGNPPVSLTESAPVEILERKTLTPLTSQEYTSLYNYISELQDEEKKQQIIKLLDKPSCIEDLTNVSLEKLRKALEMTKETSTRRRSAMAAASEGN